MAPRSLGILGRLLQRPLAVVGLTMLVVSAIGACAGWLLTNREVCRFGITAPYGVADYDLTGLGAGAYLDWDMRADPPRPNGVEYIQVVRLGDAVYDEQLARIPEVAKAQRGAAWLVGNEPDNTYAFDGVYQDNLAPATYAERYQAVYAAIKAADPRARVGIGGIVQPTPVRLEYLDRVLAAYQAKFGSRPPTDFWFIHAFVLNETDGEWGAGMPIDHQTQPYAATPEAMAIDAVDSLALFARRIESFREWMAARGQRDLPLWVTEFGVLMPSDEGMGYFAIPIERTGAFMQDSFAYLQTARASATGLASDDNRLVQRWFWWTLSYDARVSGGGLYDQREEGMTRTALFEIFAEGSDCR